MKKLLLILLSGVLALGTLVGCAPSSEGGQTIDSNKTQIYFSVFDGGYGHQWALDAAEEYNKTDDKFQIIIKPNKDEWNVTSSQLEAGTCSYDMFVGKPDIRQGAAMGWLEDLSSIYTTTPEGESKTLGDKVRDRDEDFLHKAYQVDGKYYGIPFTDGFNGFIYDHEVFLQNGYLIGENGTPITSPTQKLSVGRDGEAGTIDDGHPKNLTEYEAMINKIKKDMKVYLWTGKFPYYILPLFHSIVAEYNGEDAYYLNFSFDGKYKEPGSDTEITIMPEKGYEVFHMQGRLKALEFYDNYMFDPDYYHPDSAKSTSHTDVQQTYVYGNALKDEDTNNEPAAFLYEGIWWENEAKAKFNTLENSAHPEYKFGTRDYRMMMLPLMDDKQAENGYYLACMDTQTLYVKKQDDADKLEAIKKFIVFLHTDAQLKQYTSMTGGLRPFEYTLTGDEMKGLTKFTQNMWAIYNDDNVHFLRYDLNKYMSDVAYSAALEGDVTVEISKTKFDDWVTAYPTDIMMRGTGLTTLGNAKDYYDHAYDYFKSNWDKVSIS